MKMPPDLWRELTKTALSVINDLQVERASLDVKSIVDTTVEAYRDVPDVQKFRTRLEAFVRDMIDGGAPRGSA